MERLVPVDNRQTAKVESLDLSFVMDRFVVAHEGSKETDRNAPVFIGISLGTNMSSIEVWRKILDFALFEAKGAVIIMIADRINRFNEHIFNKRSLNTGSADRYSIAKGESIRRFLEESVLGNQRIKIIQWDEVHTESYEGSIEILRAYIAKNKDFETLMKDAAYSFFNLRKTQRPPKTSELYYMQQYILWELPSLLCGIRYQSTHYCHLVHPMHFQGSVPKSPVKALLRQIASSEEFADLRSALGMNDMMITDLYFPIQGEAV